MIRTLGFLLFFVPATLFCGVLYIPVLLMQLFHQNNAIRLYKNFIVNLWARNTLIMGGASTVVEGLENIPQRDTRICYIGNHQGMADILLVLAYATQVPGFIAKKELSVIPVMNIWMRLMGCVFIDRKNLRKAFKVLETGAKNIKTGNPMVIFPEGTRSRANKMNEFKVGSLRLAFMSGAQIVPVSIYNSHACFEKNKKITKATVGVKFHPPMSLADIGKAQQKEFTLRLWDVVNVGLTEMMARYD